ncbi:hypothetical protein RYX36_028366 [Vicia faba]
MLVFVSGNLQLPDKQHALKFSQQSSITTVECQPSGVNGGMLVFVSGNLQLPDKQHALKFSQTGLGETYTMDTDYNGDETSGG